MKPIKCGKCTTCCQWGNDTAIRPKLTPSEQMLLKGEAIQVVNGTQVNLETVLAAKANGDCVYLMNGGCSIYERRPEQCRTFDCRNLFRGMSDKTFIKVIMKGKDKCR